MMVTLHRRMDMRKITAAFFISLDGVVELPEQWNLPYFNEEMGAAIGATMAQSDALMMGRVNYEAWAKYWPAQSSDNEFAAYMNTTPKFVVSTTLDTVEWNNSTLINGDGMDKFAKLKQQPG